MRKKCHVMCMSLLGHEVGYHIYPLGKGEGVANGFKRLQDRDILLLHEGEGHLVPIVKMSDFFPYFV